MAVTCRVRITPAIALQPDFQHIIHPGGKAALDNAMVIGGWAVSRTLRLKGGSEKK